MRVHGVVVSKLALQLRHHGLGIAQIPKGHVISINRLHKASVLPLECELSAGEVSGRILMVLAKAPVSLAV